MASVKKTTDKAGRVVYKVQASNGRGRRVTRSWRPQPGWSQKTIDKELRRFCAGLENEFSSGEVLTKQESDEAAKREAEKIAALKTLKSYSQKVYMPSKSITFSENARSNYQMVLDRYIYPKLGDFLLKDLTPAIISAYFINLQKNGYVRLKKGQKKKDATVRHFSHSTLVKIYNVLNGILEMAYLDDSILDNPMRKVPRPRQSKDDQRNSQEIKSYTPDMLQHILECLKNEPFQWQVFIRLMADSGARRGEICGLQWNDINFEENTICICHNLQYTASKGIFLASTKNGKSRTIDVDPYVIDLLHQLRTIQSKQAISKFCFTQENSPLPMHPQSPTRFFMKFGERYGVPNFHPHILRHTFASVAIAAGADIASVSEKLGHSDSDVTLKMYTHSSEAAMKKTSELVSVKCADGFKMQHLM